MTSTLLPGGLSNAQPGTALETYVGDDPTAVHSYFNDFNTFASGDWTNTATGVVTNAIVDGDGGWLSMLNSAAQNDLNSLQLVKMGFQITSGKQFWFKTRFKTSNATNAILVMGLIPTDTTPLTNTDGVFLQKLGGSTTLSLVVKKSSTATTLTLGTMADNTFIDAGFYYDGVSLGLKYFNGVNNGSISLANMPFATALTVTMAEANNTAAAITTTVDYIFAATER